LITNNRNSQEAQQDNQKGSFIMSNNQEAETTTLSIRLHDGTAVKAKFKTTATLTIVQKYVQKKGQELGKDRLPYGKMYLNENAFDFQTLIPKRTFVVDTFSTTTLHDAGLVPNGSITVVRREADDKAPTKGEGTFADGKRGDGYIPNHRLKGESREVKDKFNKKLSELEAQEKKDEKAKRKKELEQIRGAIQSDKSDRGDIDWIKQSGYKTGDQVEDSEI
jgi:hypothetical protein